MNQADIINFSLVGSADELLPVVLSFLLSCRWFFFFCRLSQRSLKWHYRKWERGGFGNLGSVAQLGSVFAGLHASCWHCRMTFCWKDAGWVRGNVRVCVLASVRLLVHPAHCLFPAAQSCAESVEQGVLPTLVISLFLSSPSIIVSLCRLFFF